MKFRNHFNHGEFENKGESFKLPSLTIPDETMSIREILSRHARGLPISGQKVPLYEGEEDIMPDLRHMDLADRQYILEQAADELDALKNRLNQKPKEKDEKPKTDVQNVSNSSTDTKTDE